jgi:NAD(P)-dependent dehydrogenase (short-subunit alcohol dehydrogenase family)
MTLSQQQQQEYPQDNELAETPPANSDDINSQKQGKLLNKVALITGGDSRLGRAVAIAFAQEGANVTITYINNHEDAEQTKQIVEQAGVSCLVIIGDIRDESFCQQAVQQTINRFTKLDILVNIAVQQYPQETEQLERDLDSSLCAMFYMTDAAVPYLKEGSIVINTTSVMSSQDDGKLVDYSATKGAIMTFTRSSSQSLEEKGIRVNGIAPGPVWTLQVPSTLSPDKIAEFGNQLPKEQVIEPEEIASSFVYLASDDSAYMAGQILFTKTHF